MGVRALPEGQVRAADIARLLGVSQQRADQLTREAGFPEPVAREGGSRLWRRIDVESWMLEVEWFESKPWRRR